MNTKGQIEGIKDRIREAREKKQMTQAGLAKFLEISRTAITQWEAGLTFPSYEKCIDLARLLGVRPEWIAQNQSRDKRTLQSPKTRAGYRTITISDELMRRLKEFYQRRAGYDFVFMTRTKTRFEYRNMLRWWHNLLEEAGVPEAGFHKARHYYASRLIEAGVDAKVLTGNLGHTDVAFTMNVYGHLFDDRDTRDKKRLVAAQLSTLEAA